MDSNELKEYLGMVVYLMNYSIYDPQNDKIIDEEYCDFLLERSSKEYVNKIKDCLSYAITKDDMCISLIESEFLSGFDLNDVKKFFIALHNLLQSCEKLK